MDKGLIVHSVVINDGKMLIIKRAKEEKVLGNQWDVPGGTLKDGEDPMVGAIREAKEEVGLSINNLGLFYYTSNIDQGKNKQFVRLIFVAAVKGNPDKIVLNPRDHSEFKWINFNEINNFPVVDYLKPCIACLKNHPLTAVSK